MSVERSTLSVERSAPNGAVFLSYAREDSDAARRIAAALRAAGVEVWFDQSELRGGDAWDANIRQQIKECALFVPIISANTQARPEGYFRIEWRQADRRTEAIGKSKAFIVPVCIDDTGEREADVPDSFLAVQWTRLHAGETSAAFCARVQRLLAGRSAVSLTAPGAEHRDDAERSQADRATVAATSSPLQSGPRRWFVPGACAMGIVAVLVLWHPWRPGGAPASPPAKPAAGPSLSEGRQLAAKADALFDQRDSVGHDTRVLAEQFCKQAIALAPNDAEVWGVYARLLAHMLFNGDDATPDRRALAADAANRAYRLAPNAFEARYARAYFYRLDDATYPEAERILRQLAEEQPNDKRVWRLLGQTLLWGDRVIRKSRNRQEEALEFFRRAAALPGGDPIALNYVAGLLAHLGRLEEAEKVCDEAIALHPTGGAWVMRARLFLYRRGDVDAARAALSQVPVERLLEETGTFIATQIWWCAREPERIIQALRAYPRDYFGDLYDGPKGLLAGDAHQMAGRPQAAEIEWRTALQVVERRLAAEPNSARLLVWKSRLLALLGNHEEARKVLQSAEQFGLSARDSYWAAPIPLLDGNRGKAMALLHAAMEDKGLVTRAFLRLNPTWDALRGDPRFEALVAEPVDQRSDVRSQDGTPAGLAKADQKSVAVLAFKNLSGEQDGEIFSDGVSDELTHVLGKVPGLRVTASTSAFKFKNQSATAQEIGRELGVAYVVEGTVKKATGRVRITAKLINAADGFPVWSSETLERDLKDVWAVQDEIAGVIAQNLKLKLGANTQAPRVVNPEAHALLLEGRHFWSRRLERTEENLARAAAALQRALAIDSDFAEARAALGDVWVTRGLYRGMDGHGASVAEDYAQAKTEARRALELNPALAEPRVTLAYVYYCEGKFEESESHFAQAAAMNPNYSLTFHWHSLLLISRGRIAEAIAEIERALRLDPLSPTAFWSANSYYSYAERDDASLVNGARALALRPDVLPIQSELALAFWRAGRKTEAVAAARVVLADPAAKLRWWADGDAIYVLREAGLAEEAARHADRMLKSFTGDDYRRAFVLAALGRTDEALAALQTVPTIAIPRFWFDPVWEKLREDPRFQDLLVRLRCVEEYKAARASVARLNARGGKPK